MTVAIARVYEHRATDHAQCRVLVDRLWPRGVSKEDADLDLWAKDVAPSASLRRWYGHDPGRFEEFATRYRSELEADPDDVALAHLFELSDGTELLLLTATRDIERSGAAVLKAVLDARYSEPRCSPVRHCEERGGALVASPPPCTCQLPEEREPDGH